MDGRKSLRTESVTRRDADLDIKYGLHAGIKDLVTIDDITRIAAMLKFTN